MSVASRVSFIGSWAVAIAVLLAGGPALAEWQIQPITAVPSGGSSGTFGATPAITFDNQNRPHVAYLQSASGNPTHAYGSALGAPGIWTKLTAPFAVDGATVVHLAAAGSSVYLSGAFAYGSISSGVFNGTSWQQYNPASFMNYFCMLGGMATDTAGQVNWLVWSRPLSGYPPLADGTSQPNSLDTGGKVFVPTVDTPTNGYYLVRAASDGTTRLAPMAGDIPFPTFNWLDIVTGTLQLGGDLTFDTAGNVYAVQSCNLGGSSFLICAKGPANGPFVADKNVDTGWWVKAGKPSIAVDAAGKCHIAYTTLWPYYRLNYLSETPTGWQREIIESGGNRTGYVGTFPKVLIDPQGAVHVIYADGLHGQLKHARQNWSAWQIEVIDTVGTQAMYSAQVGAMAAAMDSVGGIGVVYWDGDDGMLKYAYLAP